MIALDGVAKRYKTLEGFKVVLDRADVVFPTGRRVGSLGANGAGKSTLIRMIGGIKSPTSGRIRRTGRVSFPLGFGGTFHPKLSGRENVVFLARLYGASERHVLRYVDDSAEFGQYLAGPAGAGDGRRRRRELGVRAGRHVESGPAAPDLEPGAAFGPRRVERRQQPSVAGPAGGAEPGGPGTTLRSRSWLASSSSIYAWALRGLVGVESAAGQQGA